ncbi:MAG: hypothetical protein AAGH64_03335 [Planctomycetota bacterium]
MDTFERVFWPACAVFAALVTVVAVTDARRRFRVRTPGCSRCGYDLSGQGSGGTRAYPECGCDLTEWGVVALTPRRRFRRIHDAQASARLTRWCFTLPSLLGLVCCASAYPPFAMVNRELAVSTIGPTPLTGRTIDVERSHTWV